MIKANQRGFCGYYNNENGCWWGMIYQLISRMLVILKWAERTLLIISYFIVIRIGSIIFLSFNLVLHVGFFQSFGEIFQFMSLITCIVRRVVVLHIDSIGLTWLGGLSLLAVKLVARGQWSFLCCDSWFLQLPDPINFFILIPSFSAYLSLFVAYINPVHHFWESFPFHGLPCVISL